VEEKEQLAEEEVAEEAEEVEEEDVEKLKRRLGRGMNRWRKK
jgi:hypothetical protein